LLATLWVPDTNPIGAASHLPLGIVVLVALTQRLSGSRAIALAAPAIFLVLAVLSAGFPLAVRRFPNADDYVGYYIWNLAACCFAMEVARAGSRGELIYGGVVMFPMGWLIVLECVARSSQLIQGSRGMLVQAVLGSSVIWCALFAVLMYRAARPYRRASRIERGFCGRCGYDMRESPQRCPECREPWAARPTA
jgi:hypothetical protein